MAAERELHRFRQGHAGPEHEHFTQHDVGEQCVAFGQQKVAHRDQAKQFAIGICHITVSDERDLDQFAQFFDRFIHGHFRMEHGICRFHETPDGARLVRPVAFPLAREFRRCANA